MSLIITGIIDGPLSGGIPKAIELFVTEDIADLSAYGIGSANNGGGSDGQEFTLTGSASAGDYIYIASETTGFEAFFGFAPTFTAAAANINGDDAIELFKDGAVIDLFGDINVDGTGQPWDHLDGWASRNAGATASPVFDLSEWTFSGPNALDDETLNDTAAMPFPLQTFDTGTPPPPPVVNFVINEIDSDQTSTDSAEFVELYDGGVGGASLDGISLVLFNGSNDAPYTTIALDGFTTDENGYFVIGSANVPNVDLEAFTTNGLQNGPDAVALYRGVTLAPEDLIDSVVYGTADDDDAELLTLFGKSVQWDESANGDPTGDALARQEDGSFVAQAPTPGEENNPIVEPPAEITLISTIQGANGTQNFAETEIDDRSDLVGQTVTVQAIVTADYQDGAFGMLGDLNGFYIQEEEIDYDFNDLTSEGIFIFDGSAPAIDVAYGDLVQITGTVAEFNGETQISATLVEVLSSDQMVPSAVDVIFPTADIMLTDDGDYVANLEAYEGMLVNIAQDMTVSEMFNLDRFGTYEVTSGGRVTQFTQDNAPDAAGYEAHLQETAKRTLQLDDGFSTQNPADIRIIDGNDGLLTVDDSFRMGDTISQITGVIGYSFDAFKIQNASGVYAEQNERPETPEMLEGNFKVASLNVLNYFTTIDLSGVTTDNGSDPRGADSVEEFERQAQKMVNAIVAIDADVLGLIEIENDFAGDVFAIKDVVDRVNAELGATVYGFVDPGQEFVGGDAIANALIYKVDKVGLQGDMAILEDFDGRNFLDPLGAGRDLNRPAIAQTFEDLATGQTLTVSVNHLKSKGSLSGVDADIAQGDGQGNNNATRTEAADILAAWLDADPTGQGAENVLILGDLNAYANEDPLTSLAEDGYTDIAAELLGNDAYSYVFDGQIGTLDYALANASLMDSVVGVTEWHVNADEADALDYNLDFGRSAALFDGDTPARNSDHDPVIVSFQFDPVYNLVMGTGKTDFLFGTAGNDQIEGLGKADFIFACAGDDLVLGGDGHDTIFAGDGADIIYGGADGDMIFAGAGEDTIFTGTGNDRINGGADADTFVFSHDYATDGARDRTTIIGFDADHDVIDLGGTEIVSYREHGHKVTINLDGGFDRIVVVGVSEFDDIQFVDDLPMV